MTERNHLFCEASQDEFHRSASGVSRERPGAAGKLFDSYANVYVDIAAVLAELGRQPYSAHDFLVKYQDRVLMGKTSTK